MDSEAMGDDNARISPADAIDVITSCHCPRPAVPIPPVPGASASLLKLWGPNLATVRAAERIDCFLHATEKYDEFSNFATQQSRF